MVTRRNPSRFFKGDPRAVAAGRIGGAKTHTKFRDGDPHTIEAARKGGKISGAKAAQQRRDGILIYSHTQDRSHRDS